MYNYLFFSVKQKESECYFRSLLKIFLIRRKINVKNNIRKKVSIIVFKGKLICISLFNACLYLTTKFYYKMIFFSSIFTFY